MQNNFLGKFNKQQKKYILKKISKTVARTKRKASCKEIFRMFDILTLAVHNWSQYYSAWKTEKFKTNSGIHNIVSKRYIYELNENSFKGFITLLTFHHQSSSGHGAKVFKPVLRDYLFSHSLYSIEEFASIKNSQF
jgi:hypothetical protein